MILPRLHINKKGLLKRLMIVAAILAVVYGGFLLLARAEGPHMQYKLVKADCSPTAIAARNQSAAYPSTACVIMITATNLKNKPEQFVDWDGIGGVWAPPNPIVRIETAGGKFCWGSPNSEAAQNFEAHETKTLTLTCQQSNRYPGDYDTHAEAHPAKLVINDSVTKVTLYVK